MKNLFLIGFTVLFLSGCCDNSGKSCTATVCNELSNKSECEADLWFEKGEWLNGCSLLPDNSIDRKQFAKHYASHSDSWNKLFVYLKETDLTKLPDGQTVVIDDRVKSGGISTYTTRAPGEELLEAHLKEIDLQLMVEGSELMGVSDTTGWNIVKPYQGDALFGKVKFINYRVAKPDRFMIFFPGDAHNPCVQYGDTAKVRKIVFKIKVD